MAIVRRVLEFPLTRLVLTVLLMGILAAPPLVVLGKAKLIGAAGSELVIALATVMALFVVTRLVERRPFVTTFFPPRPAARELAVGFAIGAALFTAVVATLAACGFFRVTGMGTTGLAAAWAMLRALGFFFLVAVFEETLFRGIVFRLIEEMLGTWAALAASAILFGLVHLGQPHANAVAAIAIALEAGVLLGAMYVQTRTLWLPIGMHWAWNFFEGPVFGTNVSGTTTAATLFASSTDGPTLVTGGEFGPEAGLAAIVLCTAAGIAFVVRAVKRARIVGPLWRRRAEQRALTPSAP